MFTVFKTTKFEYNSFSNYYQLTIQISFHKRTITTFEINLGFGGLQFVGGNKLVSSYIQQTAFFYLNRKNVCFDVLL